LVVKKRFVKAVETALPYSLVKPDELAIFLFDIFIRLLLIAGLFYVLYKIYLIDMTIENLYSLFIKHINIYLDRIASLDNIFSLRVVTDSITNQINGLNNSREQNKKDAEAIANNNDNNFMAVFITVVGGILILFTMIIVYTGTYKHLTLRNMMTSFIFNLIFIIISQLIFFYFVYAYMDPIQFATVFYYNYDLYLPRIQDPILALQQQQQQQPQLVANNTSVLESQLINSQNTAVLFSGMLLCALAFFVLAILAIINYLVVWNNMNLPYLVIPLSGKSFMIYTLLASIAFMGFIMLLLIVLNRIQF
jgi:hypothetical protein